MFRAASLCRLVLMTTISTALRLPNAAEISPLVDSLIRAQTERPAVESRAQVRRPFAKLITLTPVNKSTLESLGDPISVVSKEISAGGIGFFHQQVIPYRYVLIPVRLDGISTWLLTRLRWCRFVEASWYESGSQFVKTVVNPPFGIH